MRRRSTRSTSALAAAAMVVTLLFAHLASPSTTCAQEASAAEARRLFEEGRGHARAERWAEAVTAFERSRELVERSTTLFNLAAALVRVGRALDALHALDDLDRIADPTRDRALLEDASDLRASATLSTQQFALTLDPPDATLEIDGEPVAGTGPERQVRLDPGTHGATISAPGYASQRIELAPGQIHFAVTLEASPATLTIEPSVPEAEVTVDGEPRGVGRVVLELPAGLHSLRVTHAAYEPMEQDVTVERGQQLTLAAALTPLPEPTGPDLPLIVGLAVGGAALLGVAIVLAIVLGAPTDPAHGGSSGVVFAPLITF